MHAFKLEGKATRSIQKNKNIFINVMGGNIAMSIRWGKLTISFWKKHFSCVNYMQLLI